MFHRILRLKFQTGKPWNVTRNCQKSTECRRHDRHGKLGARRCSCIMILTADWIGQHVYTIHPGSRDCVAKSLATAARDAAISGNQNGLRLIEPKLDQRKILKNRTRHGMKTWNWRWKPPSHVRMQISALGLRFATSHGLQLLKKSIKTKVFIHTNSNHQNSLLKCHPARTVMRAQIPSWKHRWWCVC